MITSGGNRNPAKRRLLAGEATHAVAADLNARGVPASRGGRWDLIQVKRLAISPTNAGLRTHLGVITSRATWPPLIPETDHRVLVAKLTDPARKTVRDGSIKHLLVGIAICGVCGAPCRRVKNRNTPSYMCGQGFCVARAQVPMHAFVTEVVLARLSRPDVWDLFSTGDDTEAVQAAEDARVLRARLNEFEDAAAAGRITVDGFSRIEAKLGEQIKAAERRARPRGMPAVVLDTAGPAANAWQGLSVPPRRELVRGLLAPRILPTGKGARFFDPTRVEIVWKWNGE